MEMPKITEVKRYSDSRDSLQERNHALIVENIGPQYSAKGCSCSTFLGATTQKGCCYS